MVSSISQSFYESINPTPELRNISDFGLKITAANGEKIPYIGYILAPVSGSHFGTLVDEIQFLSFRIPRTIGKFRLSLVPISLGVLETLNVVQRLFQINGKWHLIA